MVRLIRFPVACAAIITTILLYTIVIAGENENAYMTFDFYRDFPETEGDSGNNILGDICPEEVFYVKIYAHNVKNLKAWEFRFRFNTAFVEFIEVRPDSVFLQKTVVEENILNKNKKIDLTVFGKSENADENIILYGAGYVTSTDTATAPDGSGLIGVLAFKTTLNFLNTTETEFEFYRLLFMSINDPEDGGDVITENLGKGILIGGSVTEIDDETMQLPRIFKLFQNFPNPFNPSTKIPFQIDYDTHVTLSIYNSLGQLVTTLVNRFLPKGTYRITFYPERLPSGVYFYTLRADSKVKTMNMLYLK